jgi:hypothetical protein
MGISSSIKGRNAYQNKYDRNESQLSPTYTLVQNKLKEPTNTHMAFMKHATHIYD